MATDFGNFPIWANNGTLTTPLFIDTGWVCGAVDPNHMNWWYNRTDNALLDLDGRVTTNTTDIDDLTTIVNNLSNSIETSGALGYYVSDSNASISKSWTGTDSPGISDRTTLKTFNHTIQNTGDVHLLIGFEAGIQTTPDVNSSSHFKARHIISVNGDDVMAGLWGHTSATGSPRMNQVLGMHSAYRNINAGYNWALIGQSGFDTWAQGEAVAVKLDAYIDAGNRGSITFGIPKLIVVEIRATNV